MGYYVTTNDLHHGGVDYLTNDFQDFKYVITDPPFSLWDEFVIKAKTSSRKVMVIGRLNYLGINSRYRSGLWSNLKAIYCFNRYVDYQTPYRNDGHFHVGAMATAWFLWDAKHESKPTIDILDVQQYATLGNFKGSSEP